MIVRRPNGQHLVIAPPQRIYAPWEREDGTVMTPADLDRVIGDPAKKAATARQREVYDAMVSHDLIQLDAARSLGMTQGAFRSLLLRYCRNTGTDYEARPKHIHAKKAA